MKNPIEFTLVRALVRWWAVVLVSGIAALPVAVCAARPNVLFIAVDDLVPTLGCYGDALALTPEIDSLAGQGMTFLNHHCQWAVCGPSRAALTTSLMPEETNVMGFKPIRAVLPDVITMPQHFRDNGYETACSGKFHDYRTVGTITDPNSSTSGGADTDDVPSWSIPYVKAASGYNPAGKPAVDDSALPDSDYTDHKILTDGLGLLDNVAAGDKPFFLAVGFKKPHLAFIAPKRCWDLHDRAAFPLAAFGGLPVDVSSNNSDCLTNNGEILGYEPYDTTGLPTEAQQRELLHGYYACVSFIDDLVGQLLDKLAATDDPVQAGRKMSETTIVVLWGDHGFHLGDHGKWAKHTAMERGTSCPLIIYDPANPGGGAKTTSPANSMDIYPTLCELAGLPVPEQPLSDTVLTGRPLRGRSLVPVLGDPDSSVNHGAISQFSKGGAYGYGYRTERFRYIEWVNGSNVVVARDLYDYQVDPLETRNLVDDPEYAAVVYQLSRSMRAETTARGSVRLQSSSPIATGGDAALPGVGIGPSPGGGNEVELSWPGSGGVTYDVLSNPDLEGPWTEKLSDVPGSSVSLPATPPRDFFRIGIGDNTPPVFDRDPVVGESVEPDQAYAGSLAAEASDADVGDDLSFSKSDGPPWLSVAENGDLGGMPVAADLGANFFTVEVSDNHGATDFALLQITVAEAPTEAVVLEHWQFSDPPNTGLTSVVNIGTAGSGFASDAADEVEADGLGALVCGDDPGANMVTDGITADRASIAGFAGGELTSGVYEIEYRVSDWQLTTAQGLGIEFDLRDADGTLLKTILNSTTAAADTRIRVVDTGSGGSNGQKAGFGTAGSEGLTIRTTIDLANGQWWTDSKLDSAGSFSSAVATQTLSGDFSGIAGIRFFAEGSTAWGGGDFVTVDELKLTRLP